MVVNPNLLHNRSCWPHYAPMALVKSSDEQTAKLYQQLVNILEEMMLQAGEQDHNEENADESGLIQGLVEEAEERGLDGEGMERILKTVVGLRKKAREE